MAHRVAHRLVIAALLALGLASAAGAQMPDKPSPHVRAAVTDYDAELARQCPGKRLDLLSPADLSGALESFEGLTAAETERERAAEAKACAHIIAGLSCGNLQMLVAIHQAQRMRAFAAQVCAVPQVCTARSTCSSPK